MNRKPRELDPGYTAEVDRIDESTWYELLAQFSDASIYQTWAFAEVICGRKNMSHLVLKYEGEVSAMAQVRIARVPLLNQGVAYVHWGPMFRKKTAANDVNVFRQVLRALRNEFVCLRGLVLRSFPMLFDFSAAEYARSLAEEGFLPATTNQISRTIVMHLNPSIDELRQNLRPHWQRELKVAEKKTMSVEQGTSDELFSVFIDMYKEMVGRKKFVEPNDIHQFRSIQRLLPEAFKMWILNCRSGAGMAAGAICSSVGTTGLYLFGATTNGGMKSRGSYLLQWKIIEQLKELGIERYNLNGINPVANPGTYKFKSDLAGNYGSEAAYLGRFDAYPSSVFRYSLNLADRTRRIKASVRSLLK